MQRKISTTNDRATSTPTLLDTEQDYQDSDLPLELLSLPDESKLKKASVQNDIYF